MGGTDPVPEFELCDALADGRDVPRYVVPLDALLPVPRTQIINSRTIEWRVENVRATHPSQFIVPQPRDLPVLRVRRDGDVLHEHLARARRGDVELFERAPVSGEPDAFLFLRES